MKNLDQLIIELESKITHGSKQNLSISKAAVEWHIAHILSTTSQIVLSLKRSNTDKYKKTFSIFKLIVFTFNKIPRGKSKAPKNVQPDGEISTEYLQKNIQRAKKLIDELKDLNPKNHFAHPIFKILDLKETITFLKIHTQHHLAIIDDIIKSKV